MAINYEYIANCVLDNYKHDLDFNINHGNSDNFEFYMNEQDSLDDNKQQRLLKFIISKLKKVNDFSKFKSAKLICNALGRYELKIIYKN